MTSSLYRMPGVGQTTATPTIRGIEKQGVSTPVSPTVSNSGRFLDFRNPEQAGRNALAGSAGFNDFMGTLLKIGGEVSDKTQLKVEQFRAGDLINNQDALNIIKEGRGPANGLLWSFRPEVQDAVVNAAAGEVTRDAREKYLVNLSANTKLKDPTFLASVSDADLAKERLSLEDPEATRQLRNLTSISPAGTAKEVAAYQEVKSLSWQGVQERRMKARLDNNSALLGKEWSVDVTKFQDLLDTASLADSNGLGGEIEKMTDDYVGTMAPDMAARADMRGVDKFGWMSRQVSTITDYANQELVAINQQIDEGLDPDLTDLDRAEGALSVLRGMSDHSSWKGGEGEASLFDRVNEQGGSIGQVVTEVRGKIIAAKRIINDKRGENAVAKVETDILLLEDPNDPKAVSAAVMPTVNRMKTEGNYVGAAKVLKASMSIGSEVRRIGNEEAALLATDWRAKVLAITAQNGVVSQEMIEQVAGLDPRVSAPVLEEIAQQQRYDRTEQREVLKEENQASAQAISQALPAAVPDTGMYTTKSIDTLSRIQGMKGLRPEIASLYQGEKAMETVGAALKERTKTNVVLALRQFVDKNGPTAQPTPAQLEKIKADALNLAAEQILKSLPRVDPKQAATPPPAKESFAAEQAAAEETWRKSDGRPTMMAAPFRIRDKVLREYHQKYGKNLTPEQQKLLVDDVMRKWNAESAGLVDEKGQPIYGNNIAVERERIRKEIQKDGKANGTVRPRIDILSPYGGTAPGTKPQSGSANPYGGNRPGTGDMKPMGPQASVPATPANVGEGWTRLGLAPEDLGPMSPTLAAVAPKSETVSVTVPANELPPAVVEKTGGFLLKMVGVDLDAQADGSAFMPKEQKFMATASAEGMAVPVNPQGLSTAPVGMAGDPLGGASGPGSQAPIAPATPNGGQPVYQKPPTVPAKPGEKANGTPVQNLTPSNIERVSRLATGKEQITADTPPLPQVDAGQEAVVISLNARSRDNPWVYAVLAANAKSKARNGDVSSTLPGWMFPRKGLGQVPDFATGSFGGTVERPANGVRYEDAGNNQGGFDVYMESKRVPALLPGRVKEVGFEGGYGNFIVVESIDPRNGNTVDVLYGHIGNARGQGFQVKEGDTVNAGTIIGQQGSTGNVLNADSIMSVDFLAPAAKGSGSQVKYSDFQGLRKLLGDGLTRGQLPGRPNQPGVMRAGGGGGTLSEKHPYVQAIGFAEGNLDQGGRPTGSYAGHTDSGNGARNVGIFSAQGSGGTPEAANRVWIKKLEGMRPQFDQQLRMAGAKPGTPAYEMAMVNLLDLYVQAPAAVTEAGGLLSRIPEMLRGGGRDDAIAAARAASFRTASGALDAPGFGNNWDRLLADQRRRARALKARMSS